MNSALIDAETVGIEAVVEFLNPRRRISGRRRLRGRHEVADKTFSIDEVNLLKRLFSTVGLTRRWRTLAAQAGVQGQGSLLRLVRKLLQLNWVEVVEQRDRRGWNPVELQVVKLDRIRVAAGLENLGQRDITLSELRAYGARSPVTAQLQHALDRASATMQLRRRAWLPAIDAWLAASRNGTLRDFAYALTGKTKGLTHADIAWLRVHEVTEACSLVPHAFQLLVSGHFALAGDWQPGIEWVLGPFPGPTSIGEDALSGAVRLAPRVWVVVENRTVFDRAARISSRCGVIWVPGYAPVAWLAMVGKLLDRMPARAMVLCDPDPAGVELALRALRPWRERGLVWQVEGMSLADAATLPSDRPLSAWDAETLRRVAPEVAGTPLEDTVHWLAETRRKVEQEPVWSEDRLKSTMRSWETSDAETTAASE